VSISAVIAPSVSAWLHKHTHKQTHTQTNTHTHTHTHLPITAHCNDECAAVSFSDNQKLSGVGASSKSSGDCDKLVCDIEEPST
jgi:hypothetical protein